MSTDPFTKALQAAEPEAAYAAFLAGDSAHAAGMAGLLLTGEEWALFDGFDALHHRRVHNTGGNERQSLRRCARSC